MKRVYIELGNHQYSEMFRALGFEIVNEVDKADLVCFTGGADVTPDLYGDKKHKYTGNDVYRDEKEKRLFEHCFNVSIPMVGICRGGQFLNVMSGGRMYQDVTGHTAPHEIVDLTTGETIYVSSTHHQMIMPSEQAIIVATSINVNSERQWYDNQIFRKDVSNEGIEVVYYSHTRCLCFQPHPEFNSPAYDGMKRYFVEVLNRYLGV